ncbi:MAG: ribosomal protein S18-alanine N-acetyltransferase [Nevskiales bacterium]|nr:ribosomal protein S18-alanine N-acetyltransferase [Nevskiales bacterium]
MSETQLPQVLDIECRAYPFPWTEGIFRDCFRVGYSRWVVVRPDGNVVAYAFMSMAVGEAHILNLCVEPACQRQGLGRFLLSHLRSVAWAAGMNVILLEVRKSNQAAMTLYLGAGFHKLGQRKAYYPAQDGSEDAWLLACPLDPQAPPP